MVRFKHVGATYILRPEEIVKHLPPGVRACALKRGKSRKRSEQRTQRERVASEIAERKRDEMLMGSKT